MTAAAFDGSGLPLIPIHDPELWADPHPLLDAARERSTVGVTDDGTPVVLRRREMEELLRDSANYLVVDRARVLAGMATGPIVDHVRNIMGSHNPPQHARLRGLVSRPFTPRRIDSVRPLVAGWADERLAEALAAGAFPAEGPVADIPMKVIAHLLGIPPSDEEWFGRIAVDFGLLFSFDLRTNEDKRKRVEQAISDLSDYTRVLIADRRVSPRGDLLSDLVAARDGDDRLTEAELVALVGNLLWAGVDTTRTSIPIALLVLARHPDQLARLRADPSLIPNAVEEIFRYEPTVFMSMREPARDVDIDGVPVPAGTPVLLSYLASERDPRVFDDPDRFKVDRPAVRTLAFGVGIHHCIGAALARAQIQEIVGSLVARCDELTVTVEPAWTPLSVLRHPEGLTLAAA